MTNTDEFTRFTGGMGRKIAMEITPTMDGQSALEAAGLDWQVVPTNLSELMDKPGASAHTISTRSDTGLVLGVNGAKHRIIQNDVLAELGDTIRSVRPDAKYVQGGMKDGGKTCFLVLEFDQDIDLGGGDTVQRRIMLGTAHTGGSLFGLGMNGRMACTNQWASIVKGKKRIVSISHTASSKQRISFAHHTLAAAVAQFDEWDNALRKLVATPARASDHFKAIVGPRPDKEGRGVTEWENKLDRLWDEYQQDFNANLVGTAAGIFMAAQGCDEHRSRVHGGEKMRDEARMAKVIRSQFPMAAAALRSLATV
jgi:hypothetical protein